MIYMSLTFILKILFLVLYAIFVRGILPRHRIDQFTHLNWKTYIFYIFIFFILFSPLLFYLF